MNALKTVNIISAFLLLVGGLNWGLVGFLDFNLVGYLFGAGSIASRLIYILVGLSFLWELTVRYNHLGDFVCTEHHARFVPVSK